MAARSWRALFVILEIFVLAAFFAAIHNFPFGILSLMPRSSRMFFATEMAALGAWIFLLLGSPFFLRSLRGWALTGWAVAVGILIYVALSV